MADNQHERLDIARPPDAGDWLWDFLMDRLTVPLGPADQNIRPMGAWREQWIVMAERGSRRGRTWNGQTPTEQGFLVLQP
jgi:hypothetical protein